MYHISREQVASGLIFFAGYHARHLQAQSDHEARTCDSKLRMNPGEACLAKL